MTLNHPIDITIDKPQSTVYFEKEKPIAVSFTLPNKGTEWFDLKRKTEDDIIDLIQRIKRYDTLSITEPTDSK